jgi:hypothetical protein
MRYNSGISSDRKSKTEKRRSMRALRNTEKVPTRARYGSLEEYEKSLNAGMV